MLTSEKILKDTIIYKLNSIGQITPDFKPFSDCITSLLYQINRLDIDYQNPNNSIMANNYSEKVGNLLIESMEKRYISKQYCLELIEDVRHMRQQNFDYVLKHLENTEHHLSAVSKTTSDISDILSPLKKDKPQFSIVNTIKKLFNVRDKINTEDNKVNNKPH